MQPTHALDYSTIVRAEICPVCGTEYFPRVADNHNHLCSSCFLRKLNTVGMAITREKAEQKAHTNDDDTRCKSCGAKIIGKISNAQYCSDKCRSRANAIKRTQARRAAARKLRSG
jgi:hypothetical protein